MTRTNKWTHHESRAESHFFTHNGNLNENPTNIKKNGAGKGNWGKPGDEIQDYKNEFKIRRGSNSETNEQKFDDLQHCDDVYFHEDDD
ncbi:hypothetical protein WICMUC_001962 [Wickerhamomyces mucosus]|uniref:Hyaluronan/mRNA-binding protein domain-containing protein n=1 Tax=Wickerhamomyces mucosus TaxID=1378264 RepID=A0A9P8TFK2_9ASCO|nr:hypothetical protein WICMUC_001962 [Wickerhamomyces mucosus]